MKFLNIFVASAITSSIGYACPEHTELKSSLNLIILPAEEYESFKQLGGFSESYLGVNKGVDMTNGLYSHLLDSGRVVRVNMAKATNCVGNLTD